jgi:NADPH:quinone reductase-like Zn-dependent oxidoreductase
MKEREIKPRCYTPGMSVSSMKAVVFDRVGGPEVLEVRTMPKPVPGSGEVTVRVRACALNLLDYYLRSEEDPEMPMPHILGSDIAGEIAEIGEGVTGWAVGEAVMVSAAIEVEGGRHRIIGYQTQGGYAEFAAVPARNLLRKPEGLSFEEAASMPLVYATAYHQMFTRGGVRCGQTVLVMGASGGVGSASVQLCRVAGAKVIATVGTDGKMAQAREIGADAVVNHGSPQWTSQVLALTGNRGVDVVCEHLGGDYLAACIELLAHGGRAVTIGATTGSELRIDISKLFRKEASIIGSYMGTRSELAEAVKLAERGRIRPVISQVFPLEQVQEAHRFLESRRHFGKIVLTV